MPEPLVFGWRTALLSVAVVQLLAIAVALPRVLANRVANRTLAALLVVLAGILTPWLIGFAGAYDRWPWLTFAPFAITLAVAPLLWFYAHALVTGDWPARAGLHLTPAAIQAAALSAAFALPLDIKDGVADVALGPMGRIGWVGAAIGLAGYGIASLRLLSRYRALLAAQHSDDGRYAARWLSGAVSATLVLLPVWTVYALWDAVAPLDYVALMGLHIAIAGFALYLAIEGWRHAGLRFPTLQALTPTPVPTTPSRDWSAIGAAWSTTVRAEGWAADPELSLARLARRLGTNTGHLSRALNEGMGVTFSAFVNTLRCQDVATRIDAGADDDLLDLAFAAGFNSKASFNRAFLAAYGVTPSAYRRAARTSQIANIGGEARI